MRQDLQAQGFYLIENQNSGPRFEKRIENFSIPIDFLVEYPTYNTGTATVDDIPANVLPGIERALKTARVSRVKGLDLHGVRQTLTIRVCEVGPFLALKLRAFGSRQQPKDAFDILYTLKHYDGGTTKAVEAFSRECKVGNPACQDALECLRQHFESETSSAPVRAAHFIFGDGPTGQSEEQVQIQQEMVDVGIMLKEAVAQYF